MPFLRRWSAHLSESEYQKLKFTLPHWSVIVNSCIGWKHFSLKETGQASSMIKIAFMLYPVWQQGVGVNIPLHTILSVSYMLGIAEHSCDF